MKRKAGKNTRVAAYNSYQQGSKKAKYQWQKQYSLQRAIGAPETKYFDVAIDGHSISTANDWSGSEVPADSYIQSDGTTVGAYTDSALNPSATGTGYGQIVGNKYIIKKIRVRGEILVSTATAGANVNAARSARIALVMDEDPKGSQLQGEQVFSDLGSGTVCNYSFRQMGQVISSFRVLKDRIFMCDPAAAANNAAGTTVSTGYQKVFFDFTHTFKKPKQVHVLNGATPATAQLSDCNIFLLAHCEGVATITAVSRCYYVG